MSEDNSFTQVAAQTFDRTVNELKTGVDGATNSYRSMAEKATKTTADMTEFYRGSMEAMAEAGQIAASETQEIVKQMTEAGQSALAESMTAFRAMMTAKTARERFELQAAIMRTSALWMVTESSRFARAGIDATERAAAPVMARIYAAADRVALHG